jgi:phosphate ABC transporter permease subunit PstA
MATTATYVAAARDTVALTSGRSRESSLASVSFLVALWFSLFFGIVVLLVLIVSTAIDGAPRFDGDLITRYGSRLLPDRTGYRAGILGTVWLMVTTAALAVPLGVAAALHLEEFADRRRWHNRLIEVNLQNLAAVPSVIYGLLAVAFIELVGIDERGIVLSGAIALALLVLPVIIITTREALRAVPREIRDASLALGATPWQTAWRQTLPAAVPGIATGTILGLSRAIGEAAPLLMVGTAVAVRFDPDGLFSQFTALPMQIYQNTSQPQEEYRTAAAAAIIVLLVMVLGLNAVAIVIRNKFQRTW